MLRHHLHTYKSGLILVDIIVALALASLFIAIYAHSADEARQLFYSAQERSRLLDIYTAHASMFDHQLPYDSQRLYVFDNEGTTTITATSRWYGNDRIETEIVVSAKNEGITTQEHSPYAQTITFYAVRAYPFSRVEDSQGTPLCTVEFTRHNVVGSYAYMQHLEHFSGNVNVTPEITPIFLTIDPQIPPTDVEVRNNIAYLSADSSKVSDQDLFAVDIKDTAHANILFSIHTGPGIASIALAGDRIFAAQRSTSAQLQTIRMPTVSSTLIESNYRLPLPYATATPAYASAIFYNKQTVYLGTEKWDGAEFSVIDVHDPSKPLQIGSYEIGSKVNDIYVRDGIAYVAASDEQQLRIIDVNDPRHPVLIRSFSPSGWERQEGKSLAFIEDSLALGRTSGGFNVTRDAELFAWATATPAFMSPTALSADIAGGVYGIVLDRSNIFAISRQVGKEFNIFNRQVSTSTMQSFALPASPQAITCDNDSLYVLAATTPLLYRIHFK